MNSVIIAILVLICVSLAAACLILWEKYESEKEKRWNEISRSVNLENVIGDRTKDVVYYSDLCDEQKRLISRLKTKNADLQDRLSDLICPQNNHVWDDVDGVKRCRKCGKERYGQN